MPNTMVLLRKQSGKTRRHKHSSTSVFKKSYKSNLSCVVSKPSWYHNLPIEVLMNIYQYFCEAELLRNIAPVCRQWRYVAMQPELWKTFYVDGEDVPTRYICQKIRDLTYLESIFLVKIAEPIAAIRQICRWVPNLKRLAIKDCSEIPEISLCNLIRCCKKLETLNLNGTPLKANRFYEEVSGLKHLKSINLSKNSNLDVSKLLSIVLNCRNLEELKISAFSKATEQLRDEDASFIVRNLSSTIKSLTLDAGALTNFSFKAILNCKKLEKLGLYRAVNLSADIFTSLWQHLPNLTILKIRNSPHITGQNIADLCLAGKNIMKNITVIDFNGCWKISDVGLDAIANTCSNLRSLSLKSCKSIFGLQKINEKCKKLKQLNIAFCINLNVDTIIPLPDELSVFIIDKSDKFTKLLDYITNKTHLLIKVCLSEYNKETERLSFCTFEKILCSK